MQPEAFQKEFIYNWNIQPVQKAISLFINNIKEYYTIQIYPLTVSAALKLDMIIQKKSIVI